jgi:hypothetical protein
MNPYEAVADLARRQHGVVSRVQLIQAGLSTSTIARLASDRGWDQVHRGVLRAPGTPLTFAQKVVAAQLAIPLPSVATSTTAAHLYGVRRPPEVIDLLVDEEARVAPPRGARLLRTRTLVDADISMCEGIRVATGVRLAIDYARLALLPDVRALLIDLRQRRLLTLPQLEKRLAEIGPVQGRGKCRRLVWELDECRCDSVLELEARQLIARSDLPPPAPAPLPVRAGNRTLHIDIAWPEARVGLEVDGLAHHSSREQLERDHRRTNLLAVARWTLLRVGWDRVERDPEPFLAEIRALLRQRLED